MARPEGAGGVAVASPSEEDPARVLARGRLGWVFAAVWLVYLAPVLQEALARPQPLDRVAGVGAVVAFGVVYVTSFMLLRQWRRRGQTVPVRWWAGTLGLSTALFVVTAVTVGEQSLGMLVFVAVQAVFILPRRAGLAAAGVCVVATEVLARLPGWSSMQGTGFAVALAAIAMWGVTGMIQRNVELALPGELASARAALDAAGIAADLPSYLPGAVDDVPPERRELLAWAIREGVTNAVRHSAARRVWVRLDADGVEVADDGRGPAGDPDAAGVRADQHGNGLAGLRERAAAAGARVTVSRRAGGGFVLRVGW